MTTWYISPSGSDTAGAGTQASPYATLAKAYAVSAGGDTISCAAGTYAFANASMGARTIIGVAPTAAGLGTVFNGNGGSFVWSVVGALTLVNIRITNIVLSSFTTTVFALTSALTLTNCQIDNIGLYPDSSGGNGGLILTNTGGSINLTGCLIYNVYVSNTPSSAFMLRTNNGGAWSLANCTIQTFNAGSFIFSALFDNATGNGGAGVTATNCIFENDGTSMPWDSRSGSPAGLLTNCNVYGFTSTPSKVNCISTPSLFVDPNNGNFNLRMGSPCIDAGTLI